ncbi:hypothetical protein HDV02_000647, partial [Globomyces sp. JEL0801]
FAGIELATLTNDVDEIQAVYQSVIDEYQIRWIDIDIEGNNAQDAGANDRRSKALAALKRANPGLRVSFTLPVLPTGLVKLGIDVLQNAKDNKLELDLVNIMAMDYGNIKDGATAMGKHAIEAAEATFKQLQNMGLTKTTIGITTMIGNNDVAGEIFTLDNAKEINEYYLKTPFVSLDTFIANGELLQTSQIPQENFQFQKLLNQGASPVCNAPEKATTTTTPSNVSTTSKISEATKTKDPQTTTNKAVTSWSSTNTKTTTIKFATTNTTTPTATINKTTATIRTTTPSTSTGTTTATTRTTTKSTTTTTKRTTPTATPTTRTIAKQTTFNTKTTTKTATPNTTKTTTTMTNSKTTTKTSTTLT